MWPLVHLQVHLNSEILEPELHVGKDGFCSATYMGPYIQFAAVLVAIMYHWTDRKSY